MSFRVSVRDTRILEERLRSGKSIELPDECVRNANVLYAILKFAPRVLPRFSSLNDGEVNRLAQSVAYLLRTDIVIPGSPAFGMSHLYNKPINTRHSGIDNPVHFRNDPETLSSEWNLPKGDDYSNRGAEFFRCYSGCLACSPEMLSKLNEGSMSAAFSLADMTAFLLDPQDLVDYRYAIEEVVRFQETLERQAREI